MADKVNGDLVSRQALLETVRNYRLDVMVGRRPGPISSNTILRMIEQLPAIDAEPAHWISVEDRLPGEWKDNAGELINYTVFMPEYGVDIGNYAKPAKKWLCMGLPVKVTHWMPLPEPPGGKGGDG